MIRLLIITTAILAGCQTSEHSEVKWIFGKWKVTEAAVFTPEKNAELEAETISLAKSVTYDFHEDFTYTIMSKVMPTGQLGQWKFDPYARQLELITEGEVTRAEMERITRDKMTITSLLPGLGKITMHLEKND